MHTRAVAILTASQTWNSPTPADCGSAGYPAGYGIWCPGIVHIVVPGDNLWALAQAYLGDGHLWPEIEVLGRSSSGPCARPAEIFAGQILLIPLPGASAAPTPGGQPSCPPARGRSAPSASPSPSRGQATATPQQPGRSPAAPARPRQHASPALLRLLLTGLGVIAALAAAAIPARRRRRQRPGAASAPIPGRSRQAAQVVPAVVPGPGRHASAGYDEDSTDDPYGPDLGEGTEPGIPGPGPRAFLAAPPARALRPAGPWVPPVPAAVVPPGYIRLGAGDGQDVTAGIAAAGGLGLTGPGAPAAARAILGTLLTPARAGEQVPVIVPADVTALLPAPEDSGAAGIIPGLSRPPSLAAALDDIEALILRRARLAETPDAADRAVDMAAAGEPAAVLIAVPGQRDLHRLRSITATGPEAGIMVIVLGEWPSGLTCRVAADGMVTAATPAGSGLDGIRLRLLDPGGLSALTAAISTPPGDSTATPVSRRPGREPSSPVPPPAGQPGRRPAASAPELAHERPPVAAPVPLPAAGTDTGSRNRLVQVSVLGPLRITAAGQEIGTGARKARELIAFLTVHGADGATGDAISEALWPGASPGYGKRQRNIALRKARDLLRSSAGRSGPMWIILAADWYRLDPALIDADLWQFQAELEAVRTASTDQERLAALRRAVSCYRGPLCDGAGYDWTEPYAETARHRALDAWTRIAGILQDTDPEQALAALERALTHDPYNESIYQQIMRLQAAADRTDAVRRTFQLLETRLAELAAVPGSATRQLAASLVGGSGPRPRPAAAGHEKPTDP